MIFFRFSPSDIFPTTSNADENENGGGLVEVSAIARRCSLSLECLLDNSPSEPSSIISESQSSNASSFDTKSYCSDSCLEHLDDSPELLL